MKLGDTSPSDFISVSPGEFAVEKAEFWEIVRLMELKSIISSPNPAGNSSRFRANSTRLSMNISIFWTPSPANQLQSTRTDQTGINQSQVWSYISGVVKATTHASRIKRKWQNCEEPEENSRNQGVESMKWVIEAEDSLLGLFVREVGDFVAWWLWALIFFFFFF